MFTQHFDSYVCDGDKITCSIDGFECTATVYRDEDAGTPWKQDDSHGPVSDWTRRDKRPGEQVLTVDRESKRFYDVEGAMKIAIRDGWDAEPFGQGTKKERAARAVERDFEVLKAWCRNEWWYVGVAVTVSKNGVQLTGKYDHAVWGTECNYPGENASQHLQQLANEILPEALDAARATLASLCTP
jgi:hypothetical protein